MRTLPGNAPAQSTAAVNHPIWLVSVGSIAYWATESYTLTLVPSGTRVYSDRLVRLGAISYEIDPPGGVGRTGSVEIVLANEDRYSDTFLASFTNQAVTISMIFYTGSENEDDMFTIYMGKVDDIQVDEKEMRLMLRAASEDRYKTIPSEIVDSTTYPDAFGTSAIGKPIPVPFGDLNIGPDESLTDHRVTEGLCVSPWTMRYHFGKYSKSMGRLYEYHGRGEAWSHIYGSTKVANWEYTIDSQKRYYYIYPVRSGVNNTYTTTWQDACDPDYATGVTLDDAADDLHVVFRGSARLGTPIDQGVLTFIYSYGTAGNKIQYRLKLNRKTATYWPGPTAATWQIFELYYSGINQEPVDITSFISTRTDGDTDWTSWDFENLEIEIKQHTGVVEIRSVFIESVFIGDESGNRTYPRIFGKMEGYKDDIANYNSSGASNPYISGAGVMLENPAHILEAVLRDKNTFLNLSSDEVDLASLDTAATARSGWEFAFSFDAKEHSQHFIDRYGKEALLMFFWDYAGRAAVKAWSTSGSSVASFTSANIALEDAYAPRQETKSTLRFWYSPLKDIRNRFELYYKKRRSDNEYMAAEWANQDSDSHPTEALDTACAASVTTYGETETLIVESGFIWDQATARTLLKELVNWYTTRHLVCKLRTFLNGLNLEFGDLVTITHDLLPAASTGKKFFTTGLHILPPQVRRVAGRIDLSQITGCQVEITAVDTGVSP